MEFEYTEEQKMVRTNVRDFLEKEVIPVADEWDRRGPLSHDELVTWRNKLEPTGYGAMDAMSFTRGETDPVVSSIISEEVFGAWGGLAGAIGLAGAASLVAFASDKTRERLLPRLNSGELIGCGALTEPNAGSDNRAMSTVAIPEGDHYVINGTKTWVSNATIADVCMVLCKDENGSFTQFLVEKEVSPFETMELHKLGLRACPIGEVYFDNCRVPKENNVMNMMTELMKNGSPEKVMEERGMPVDAWKRMTAVFSLGPLAALAHARCSIGLAAVGLSQRATEASIKYAKERIQFGRPIASRQLVQNMITEMVFLTESCRLLAYRTAEVLSKQGPDLRMLTSLVKAYIAESAVKVTSMGIQVHGANGLSEDLPLERYFRDARVLTIPDGTTEINKMVAGREILGVSAYV